VGIDGARGALTALLAARDDAEPGVAPSMRSQLLTGQSGRDTYVLLHGLTASPPAWRAIAADLHARGSTVVVPRLLYHGYADRMTRALRDMRPQAMIDDVRGIVGAAAALGEPVTVVGHSLGATLAIDAAVRGAPIERIVAIAPFMGIASVPLRLHPLLIGVMDALPDVFLWWDPILRDRLEPSHGYPRYPLRALATGISIADAARASVHEPPHARAIDLVLNARESSISNRAVERLAREWRASGASVAVHRLNGLHWSHDVIEPERSAAKLALPVLLDILTAPHVAGDRDVRIAPAIA
jgi:pimeloyl-ACP methyl ester carboxylesterase